ncbi:MAG: molybdate ABC transporter substrate-binding protein [Pseudomonadota bacterium]
MVRLFSALVLVALCLLPARGFAAQAKVAVASNFSQTLATIADVFKQETGHHLTLVTGSTSALFAQIRSGAPYDIYFAADALRPRQLEGAGLGFHRMTYAIGRLALWMPNQKLKPDAADQDVAALLAGVPGRIALAQPKLAPYGAAARQVLEAWRFADSRLVYGQNVGQTYSFINSGNAAAGFIAAAQIAGQNRRDVWPVPQALHSPIRQDLVILNPENKAAAALRTFMQSPQVAALLEAHGYDAVTGVQ